jgi:hypothetical protein
VSWVGVFTLLGVYDGRVNAVPKSTRMMRTAQQRTSIEMRIGFTVVSPERENEFQWRWQSNKFPPARCP